MGEAAGLLLWFGVELVWLRDGSVRRGAKHRRHTSRAAKLCSEHVGHCQSPADIYIYISREPTKEGGNHHEEEEGEEQQSKERGSHQA